MKVLFFAMLMASNPQPDQNGFHHTSKKELWDMAIDFRRQRNDARSDLKKCRSDLEVRTSTASMVFIPPPKEPENITKPVILSGAFGFVLGALTYALLK